MATLAKKSKTTFCPCVSNKNYADCCGRYLDSAEPAPNAEALMRSRFTAYTLLREDYLLTTWHPSTRPAALHLKDDQPTQWTDLKIIKYNQYDANNALVEFVARYKVNGRAFKMHEVSQFVYEAGCWLYMGGEIKD